MRKQILVGIILATTVNLIANEFNINGYIRAGWQNQENSFKEIDDFAIGGKINIDYKTTYGIGTGFSLYSTNRLNSQNIGMNISYTILGEAYIKAKISKTKFKIGRQELDTPYLNTDDVGMIPNVFEGLTVVSKDISNTKIVLAHIYKYNSIWNVDRKKFERINKDNGIQIFGIVYNGFKNIKLKSWYYNMKEFGKVNYLEANYDFKIKNIDIILSGQYSNQDFDIGDNPIIYGLSLEVIYDNLTTKVAYNKTSGEYADNLWGGGPFFTSTERMTISEAEDNGEATLIGINWNLANIGLESLTFGVSYLNLQREIEKDINELDLSISYNNSSPLSFQIVYSNVKDKSYSERSFNNGRIFINYNF